MTRQVRERGRGWMLRPHTVALEARITIISSNIIKGGFSAPFLFLDLINISDAGSSHRGAGTTEHARGISEYHIAPHVYTVTGM